MSHHEDVINDLVEWFQPRLAALGSFEISDADFLAGTDVLPEAQKQLVKEAFRVWLEEKGYELSYNQQCQAFFTAAHQAGVMTIKTGHPTVTMGTAVTVNEINYEGSQVLRDVPGRVMNIQGDLYTIDLDPTLPGRCTLIKQEDLDREVVVLK